MKPPPLVYERAESVSDAVAILAEMEWGARVIAGGQSLVPMLNLRLAPLIKLVDISRIEDLRAFSDDGGRVVYGACLRHGGVMAEVLAFFTRRDAPNTMTEHS